MVRKYWKKSLICEDLLNRMFRPDLTFLKIQIRIQPKKPAPDPNPEPRATQVLSPLFSILNNYSLQFSPFFLQFLRGFTIWNAIDFQPKELSNLFQIAFSEADFENYDFISLRGRGELEEQPPPPNPRKLFLQACVFNPIRDRFKVSIDLYSNQQNSCEKWVFFKNVRKLRIRLAG